MEPRDEVEARGVEMDAWHAIQAGLVAMSFVGITIATFGPLFHLAIGYALLACALLAAAFGLRWADRAGHAIELSAAVRRDALGGQLFSGLAILVVLYYTGAWLFLIPLWPLVLFVGLLAWAVHRDRVGQNVGREVRG
jgi:hypothetical protein